MKLSKAQQVVMDEAKKRIDYARVHSFHDWFRNNNRSGNIIEMNDREVDELLEKRTLAGWIGNKDYQMEHYQMNRDGIDYLCHASSKTIGKLESMGLIEIIRNSNGENYGLDVIRILNY